MSIRTRSKGLSNINSKAFNELPLQQQKFVLEYLKDFNGQRSAKAAGYTSKGATVVASRLLSYVNVRTALHDLIGQIFQSDIADVEELLHFWTKIKRGNIADIVSWNESGLVFTESSEDMDREKSALIKKIKVTEKTSQKGDWTECKTEVELHDPLKASEYLGKYHAMFTEKIQHEGEVTLRVVYEDIKQNGT